MPKPIPSNTDGVRSKAKDDAAIGLENDVEDNTSRTPSALEAPQRTFEVGNTD